MSVRVGDRQIALGGRRQRTVVAMLALNPDRVVSLDSLVETVWDGAPPTTARTQIAICVASVRKALRSVGCPGEAIETTAPGYLLRSAGNVIDVQRFEDLAGTARNLADQGRPAEALDLLDTALGLWHGPALAGVSGHHVETRAAQLEERRLGVYEQRTALALELGGHHHLIAELADYVRQHPLREQARGHLMLAQYRAGRRADSLETFREGRVQSIEELGLEPGWPLRELHLAILRDDPALTLASEPVRSAHPTLVPAQLPAAVPTFVGREQEAAELDRLGQDGHDGADARPPAIGLITGAAGTGKTSLALHWASRAAADFPDGQLFATLGPDDDPTVPTDADAAASATGEVLGGFLRALRLGPDEIPSNCAERSMLFRSVLRNRRVLLVLDDAWSYAQVQPLLPGNGRCCVIVTSRQSLDQLVSTHAAVRIRVRPLDQAETTRLLGGLIGEDRVSADASATRDLAELCEGLPSALSFAGSRLAAKPHWSVRHLVSRLSEQARRLDELSTDEYDIRRSFEPSYRRLRPVTAQIYRRLALVDVPDFTVWLGATVSETRTVEAEAMIEDLVDLGMLEVVGADETGQIRYAFWDLHRLYARERSNLEDSDQVRATVRVRVLDTWRALLVRAARRERGDSPASEEPMPGPLAAEPDYVEMLLCQPRAWWRAESRNLDAVVRQAGDPRADFPAAGVARRLIRAAREYQPVFGARPALFASGD